MLGAFTSEERTAANPAPLLDVDVYTPNLLAPNPRHTPLPSPYASMTGSPGSHLPSPSLPSHPELQGQIPLAACVPAGSLPRIW